MNIFYSNTPGLYRERHICETEIATLVDDILKFIDNTRNVILMFLYLSAAFDTVNHSVLLKRLKTNMVLGDIH
jgi:hypothetical protein